MSGDVVDLILKDHRELEKLFDTLLQEPDKRANLVPVMSTLLTAHSRAEESEVYPAARAAGGEEDVEHSQKEHLEADQLAKKLAETDPASDEFPIALKELIDAVTHHVQEEETTVLPGMRERIDSAERDQLGAAFLAAREKHLGEQPDDITKAQLEQQAANVGLSGAASQTKADLKENLEQQAER